VVGVYGEDVVEDGAAAHAGQIEVGVVGHVDDGWLGGGGAVLDAQRGADQCVGDVGGEFTGEAHVSVGADEGELDAAGDGATGPDLTVKALGAAVEGVGRVVDGNLVGVSIN